MAAVQTVTMRNAKIKEYRIFMIVLEIYWARIACQAS